MIPPPTDPLLQELPYGSLSWENFESLCEQLAPRETDCSSCRPFGMQGNFQDGIDSYGNIPDTDRYITFQCKKQTNFAASKIKGAVSKFLAGSWVDRSEEFVLCTQEPLRTEIRDEEVRRQREILADLGIRFTVWDATYLNKVLRSHPDLVHTFFGPGWLRAYCGDATYEQFVGEEPAPEAFAIPSNFISRRVVPHGNLDDKGHYELANATSIEAVLVERKQVILLGTAGLGKSYELERLAYHFSQPESLHRPFLYSLKSFTDQSIEDQIDVAPRRLKDGSAILLLDGLDEVFPSLFARIKNQLEAFAKKYPTVAIVVSCRTNFYRTTPQTDKASTLQQFYPVNLLVLNNSEVQAYLDSRLAEKKAEFLVSTGQNKLDALLTIPYYLNGLVEQYEKTGSVPSSRIQYFNELVPRALRTDNVRHGESISQEISPKAIPTLEKLAFLLEYQGKNQCSWEELQTVFNTEEIDVLIHSAKLVNGTRSQNSQWGFIHNNVQEFLAAKTLSRLSAKTILRIVRLPIKGKLVKPSWLNTLAFLIEIQTEIDPNNTSLHQEVLREGADVLVQMDVNSLSSEIRHEVFSKLFIRAKEKKQSVGRLWQKYSYSDLVRISTSENTLLFLVDEIGPDKPNRSRKDALRLLTYFPIATKFSHQLIRVKGAVAKCLEDGEREDIQHAALTPYVHLFDLSAAEFTKLFDNYKDVKDSNVRYRLNYAIHRQGLQDQLADDVVRRIDVYLQADKDKESGLLGNELWELKDCIVHFTEAKSLQAVLSYIREGLAEWDISYFQGLLDPVLTRIEELGLSDEKCLSEVKEIFNTSFYYRNSGWMQRIVSHLVQRNELLSVFIELYNTADDVFADFDVHQKLLLLFNQECAEWIAASLAEGNTTLQKTERFQNLLRTGSDLQICLNDLLNEIEVIPLPKPRDHDKEEADRIRSSFELIFSKEDFVLMASSALEEAGNDQLSVRSLSEMWYRSGGENPSRPRVVFDVLLHVLRGDGSDDKRIVLETLEKDWEYLAMRELQLMLERHNTYQLNQPQLDSVKAYCDNKINEVDFTTAITVKSETQTSLNRVAQRLAFFIRRFDFGHYDESVYLDMLLFGVPGDSSAMFAFVQKHASKSAIDGRVLMNLSLDLYSHPTLVQHFEYCVDQELTEAAKYIIPFVVAGDHDQQSAALRAYTKLESDRSVLEEFVIAYEKEIQKDLPDYLTATLKHLVALGSQPAKKVLNRVFKKQQRDKGRLPLLHTMLKADNIRGIKFLKRYITKTNVVPESPYVNDPLYSLTSTRFTSHLIDLYEIGTKLDDPERPFDSFGNRVSSALYNLAMRDDNFNVVKRRYRLWKMKRRVMRVFVPSRWNSSFMHNLLDQFIDRIEYDYHIKKSKDFSMNDALEEYSKL